MPRWLSICVSVLIACYLSLKIGGLAKSLLHPNINDYGYSEMLINFRGGFVRRGLLGDLIYFITSCTGISPILLIQVICLPALAFVIIYFCRRFYRLKLNWWIIASPLFCGTIAGCIRKDWILYAMLIGIYWLLKDANPKKWNVVGAILLLVLGLLLHEAFIFWGVPIVLLSLITQKKTLRFGILATFILISVFGLLSIFKGSEQNAMAIVESWKNFQDCYSIEYANRNSIGALGWTLHETIPFHFSLNFSNGYPAWIVVPMRLFVMLVIYYMLSNFIFTFRKENSNAPSSEKTSFSTLLLFSFACLIPMFTVLSCDWIRLYQYISVSTFGAYVTFSRIKFLELFPKKILASVSKFNISLEKIIKPSPCLMVVLLFLLAVAPFGFYPYWGLMTSIIGSLTYNFNYALSLLL